MVFINGVEISCKTESGKCHILGYGYDPANEKMLNVLDKGRSLRADKLQKRIEHLSDNYNIHFTSEEISRLCAQKNVGKSHLAKILIDKGFASDIKEAIEKYINTCKTESDRISAEEAIEAIKIAGGVAIWAHPLGGEGEKCLTNDQFNSQLNVLKSLEIDGLECYYSRYSEEEINGLIQIANKNSLMISGGSDYHGENKSIPLGKLNRDCKNVPVSNLSVLEKLL